MDEEVKKIEEETSLDNEVFDEEGFAPAKKKLRRRRKIIQNLKCPLCEAGVKSVEYKDVYQLKKFTSVRGKIVSTEKSGMCHKHQKQLQLAVKRARYMALLPYASNE
ncbi:MAG: 30S ribosomal protein S18 [Candidatus Dojkabacteria bacterium]|jgi:small subunit ribosomal protein S18